ncbi:MAG: RsmB/NOP family class I SAM-dependent RNA methyltransferase [Halanaerobiales bacterium]|nr:RsmB/NOP family class I SAM-dependent RNA methyltransferase [Halanaerobiales bacterium]
MKRLPEDFLQRMQKLLGDEYSQFMDTFSMKRYYGLRVNTLKITSEELKDKVPFHLIPIPWVKEGFYYDEEDNPGKHHYHNAGLYYIQEPSAMAPVTMLDVQLGDRVLDLCAAPGGKTTQIGGALQGTGFVMANDINFKRAQVLAMNIERLGVTNSIVTQENPANLAKYFPNYFDRILVDAPCSGEGMFRKMPEIAKNWSSEYVSTCSMMQEEILDQAAKMLKPGGVMLYSTCTFAPEENEGSIQKFLGKHPQFELLDMPIVPDFKKGHPEWVSNGDSSLKETVRLWPHLLQGEGHFMAKLRKMDGEENRISSLDESVTNLSKAIDFKDYYEFCKDNLYEIPKGQITLFGNHLYLAPFEVPSLKGLKVVRPGWYLGELKKNRFDPSHGLALGLKPEDVKRILSLENEAEIGSYLRCETLMHQGEKGWTLVTVDGFSLGWGKAVNGILKNHYLKSSRRFY